jgi:lipoprotein-releasing system permease protein
MLMADGRVAGTFLRGVDTNEPELLADLEPYFPGQDLRALLTAESIAPSNGTDGAAARGIVLGEELARTLLAFSGQRLLVNAPLGVLTPAGILPNVRQFTMTGKFSTGMREYDSTLALIALDQAQAFFDMDEQVSGIEVKVDDVYRTPEIVRAIRDVVGPDFWPRDWMEMNRSLFAALQQEKVLMFIILVLIILVAAFNIISTLVMLAMEKQADIAILRAMGARRSSIRKIFIVEGTIIGGIGTCLGVLAGLVFTWNLPAIADGVGRLLGVQFFSPEVYFIDQLPAYVRPQEIGMIVATAVCISLLATLYPAWNAARLDPVVALRYE